MRVLVLCLVIAALSGCALVYRLPTRQGNIIEQAELDKLKPGMTRDQVRFVMGTPIASTPFRDDRWDYVGYYKAPRGDVTTRTVTVFFEGDQLTRLEGEEPKKGDKILYSPDTKTVLEQDRRDKVEGERSEADDDTGVVLKSEPQPEEAQPQSQ